MDPQQQRPDLTQVRVTQEMMERFMKLDTAIKPHVNVDGLSTLRSELIDKDIEYIEGATTVKELVTRITAVRFKWMESTFRQVRYNLEPTSDGSSVDVAVVFDVEEQASGSFIRFLPTDTATPQLTFGFSNLRGGAYTLLGHVHSTVKNHEVGATLFSKLPYFGDACEYDIQTKRERYANSIASEERSQHARIVLHQSGGPRSNHAWTLGFTRRVLLPHTSADASAMYESEEFNKLFPADCSPFTLGRKGFLESNWRYDNAILHPHRQLRIYYPLPVAGLTCDVKNELAGGPALGGDATFFRNEISMMHVIPLHKYFILNVGMKFGAVVTPALIPGAAGEKLTNFVGEKNKHSIPYSDRFFLGWRHLRGYNSAGPSVDLGGKNKEAATGGNALWALSASLNMPFWLYPNNGIAAMHLFANAGNLAMFNSVKDVTSGWKDFFTNSYAAVGAGLVVTQLPVIGSLPNGRLELNVSVPVRFNQGKAECAKPTLASVKESLRFGLVWSSAVSK